MSTTVRLQFYDVVPLEPVGTAPKCTCRDSPRRSRCPMQATDGMRQVARIVAFRDSSPARERYMGRTEHAHVGCGSSRRIS